MILRRLPWMTLALLGVGVSGIWLSTQLTVVSQNGDGPGLWPLLISIVMTCTAAVVALRPSLQTPMPVSRADATRVMVGLVLLAAFALLMPAIGLVSASVIVGALWLRLLTRESWRTTLLVPTGVAFTLYGLFVHLLEVPVPVDPWLPR